MQRNEVIDLRTYRGGDDETSGNESDAAMDELPPGTKILHGQYTITGYLNSGGFGITYRAKDSLGRQVVIKECFPSVMCFRAGMEVRVRSKSHTEEFADMVKNFVKEAHALAAMDHKNIVKVHQVFEENETAYMAIDYIDGLDLLAVIEEEPDRLNPQDIERLTRKALRAIKYVHDRGMLHRDISPDNIMLDANDEPILIDFGAAREKAKQAGRVMSRLKFVKDGYSPQEFYVEGSDQGPWSDLYSFAASLYHLISGEAPEEGQKRMSALAQKKSDPYVPLQGRIKGYSRGFLASVDKALKVIPRDRFQSADEWLGAITARPGPRYSRTSRTRSAALPGAEASAGARATSSKYRAGATPSEANTDAAAAGERSKPLTLRASELSPEEHVIRESLKSDIEPDRSRSPALFLAIVAVAVISALGTVGIFLIGGGREDASAPQSVETIAVAPPLSQPEDIAPDAAPVIADDTSGLPPADTEPAGKSADPVAAPALAETPPIVPLGIESAPEELALAAPEIAAPDGPAVAPVDVAPDLPLFAPEIAVLDVPLAAPQPEPALSLALPRARPADAGSTPDNTVKLADLAHVLDEGADVQGSANMDPASLVSNVLPVVGLTDAISRLGDAPADTTGAEFDLAAFAPAPTADASVPLPQTSVGQEPLIDTAAPALPRQPVAEGPLVARQVQYSHWDVDMPFTGALERLRNADTVRIVDVAPGADLSVSGEWIDEGVTIYTYNGERLMPDTPLSVHVLTSMTIDPDGFARGTVRYQPDGGQIDRGLLAVPVIREIGLADGTVLEARMIDRAWTISVVSFGETADSTLRVGDRLVQENTTGITFAGHEDLTRALDLLVSQGVDIARFSVLRGGTLLEATHVLTRETNG